MYPIILVAPHAQTKIEDTKIRKRLALSEKDIWRCSDPFTGELREFTCASHKHIAKTHRLVCDFNRGPYKHTAFRETDFYGNKVFKKHGFTDKEKEKALTEYWWPFHQNIHDSIQKLEEKESNVILIVDYHNTAGDHPLNERKMYMPSIVISNRGALITGKEDKKKTSIPAKDLHFFQAALHDELNVGVEMNTIFHGGYDLTWFKHLAIKHPDTHIFSVQIEYNLDLVVNPISGKTDRKALKIMQEGINTALIKLYKRLKKNYA